MSMYDMLLDDVPSVPCAALSQGGMYYGHVLANAVDVWLQWPVVGSG